MSSPEPITAPGIHDKPPQQAVAPFTQQQFFGIGQALLNGVGAFVLYALAGVQVFGVAPFGFLRSWADDLAQRADDAYSGAVVAQGSANTANTGVAILNARFNGLINGDSYYDTFDRDTPSGGDPLDALGPSYTIMYGSGSGVMETRAANDGTTVWFGAGFTDRTAWIRRDTPLATTNNQRMSVVFNDFMFGNAGDQPHVYLIGRWNDTATDQSTSSFVMAIIGDGSAEIGYVINGTYARFGVAESVSTSTGDLWDFEVGTAAEPWQFRLLQNNALKVDRTDLGHLSMKDTTPGTLYQRSGFGVDCGLGSNFPFIVFQTPPPDIQVLAAANTA